MPAPLTQFDLIVLGWIDNDYEALHTIDKNVSDDSGRKVSHRELHQTLVELGERGLAQSYVYSSKLGNYEKKEVVSERDIEDYWWLITRDGLRLLEMEPDGP